MCAVWGMFSCSRRFLNSLLFAPITISLSSPMSHGATSGSPGPGRPVVPAEKKIPVPRSRGASAYGSCAAQFASSAHGMPQIANGSWPLAALVNISSAGIPTDRIDSTPLSDAAYLNIPGCRAA